METPKTKDEKPFQLGMSLFKRIEPKKAVGFFASPGEWKAYYEKIITGHDEYELLLRDKEWYVRKKGSRSTGLKVSDHWSSADPILDLLIESQKRIIEGHQGNIKIIEGLMEENPVTIA